ncbi:cellulose synthase operon protein YhjQ/BcsQ [Roseomonas sp. GCM10028921]
MPLIGFSSPKGGVGKTTMAANIGALLAARGHDVLALDLDPQNALRLHLGLPLRDTDGFLAAIGAGTNWRQAVRETPYGVSLLPHGNMEPAQVLELSHLLAKRPELLADRVREMLADPARIVLLDSAPGPSAPFSALLPMLDLCVTVLLADAGSAPLVPQVAEGSVFGPGTLAARASERTLLVLNQVEIGSPLSEAVLGCAQAALGGRLIGIVARDAGVSEAMADRRLAVEIPGCRAAEDLAIVAEALVTRLDRPAQNIAAKHSVLTDWRLRR